MSGRRLLPRAFAVAALLAIAGMGGSARGTGDASRRALEEDVNAAIDASIQWLRDAEDDLPAHSTAASYPYGVECLVFHALLMSGFDLDDPLVERLERRALLAAREVDHTYTLSFALLGLVAARTVHENVVAELIWRLEAGQQDGTWGYVVPRPRDGDAVGREHPTAHWLAPSDWRDHSNTQVALLALRTALDYGHAVDPAVFDHAARHFLAHQNRDGGFGYGTSGPRRGSYVAMTAGGLGSLVICGDVLEADDGTRAVRRTIEQRLEKGLAWMAHHDSFPASDGPWPLYAAYAVERLGHYAGVDEFGGQDWYAAGARWLVGVQLEDGSWSESGATGAVVGRRDAGGGARGAGGRKNRSRGRPPAGAQGDPAATAFALLFLKRASYAHTARSDEVFVLLSNLDPQAQPADLERVRGRILKAGDAALPHLVKALFLPTPVARRLADECLCEITGEDMGLAAARGDPAEERRARERWVRFLLQQESYKEEQAAISPGIPGTMDPSDS